MAEMKTTQNNNSVEAFLNKIADEQKRKDAYTILELMKKATKSEPKMWGSAIIGLGEYSYTLSNGKVNPWFQLGFSPRKKEFSLYLMGEKAEKFNTLLGKIGKHSMGKGCLYVNKLADIDTKALQQLFELQVKACKEK